MGSFPDPASPGSVQYQDEPGLDDDNDPDYQVRLPAPHPDSV